MKLADLLQERLVEVSLKGTTKPEVLRELAEILSRSTDGLSADALARVLAEREELASTGIGDGVAIPHGKSPEIQRLVVGLGLSPEGVDFEAIDGKPSHIFVVLVAPEGSAGDPLKALARISRVCREATFRKRLLQARNAHEAFEIFIGEDARH